MRNDPNEVFESFTSDTRFYACVGTKGSGKTYFTKQNAIAFARANPELTVTILDPHGTYGKTALKNINVVALDAEILAKDKTAYTKKGMTPPGMLIIDDVKEIWDNDSGNHLKSLCIRMRHEGVDVFICAHSFMDVPPRIYTFIDDFYIFRISENYETVKHKLPRRITPEIIKAANELKWKFDKNGNRIGSEKIHVANYE